MHRFAARGQRSVLRARSQGPQARPLPAVPQESRVRPADGNVGHRVVAPLGSPPHGLSDGAVGKAKQGWRASWGRRAPNGECDDLARPERRTRGIDILVPLLQGPPQRRRDRPRPRPHLRHATVSIMAHDYPAGVARESLRRFRGNVRAFLQHRLPRRRFSQHFRINVDHDLVALAGVPDRALDAAPTPPSVPSRLPAAGERSAAPRAPSHAGPGRGTALVQHLARRPPAPAPRPLLPPVSAAPAPPPCRPHP